VVRVEKPPPGPHAKVANAVAIVTKRFYGSGFIVEPSGLILTNKHDVEGAREIMVYLNDNTRLRATVLYEPRIDMAILQVHYEKPLPAIKWGDSERMRPGDPVIAIGNPLGIGVTVTAGIVSALDRDIHETPYDSFIQTDAAINPGNSGGPLFNAAGEVIGINTALYSPGSATSGSIGLGFAIPSNDAQFVLREWREYGRTRPGWIGVVAQPVTPDIADAVGLAPPQGVIVAAVDSGSPAASASIRQGDIILKVGDDSINRVHSLTRVIAAATLGNSVPIVVWRHHAVVTVPITVVEDPSDRPPLPVPPVPATPAAPARLDANDIGVRLSAITPVLRKEYAIAADQKGVVITAVVPNSIAANRGILPGDVVVRFGDDPVTSTENLKTLVEAAQQAQQRHELVLLQDKRGPRWIGLPLFRETD
jgi:serine protease Do